MTAERSPLREPDPTAAATVREAGKVVGWGLALWGVAQLAMAVFSRNATAMVAVQAVVAEWGAGRLGITWSDPLAPMPTWRVLQRRAGLGVAAGAVAAALVVGIALATGGAAMAKGSPAVGLLAVGLVVSVLTAVRDELLLRGVVLRVTRGLLPPWASLLACGAAAAAARFGHDGVVGLALAVEGLRGLALGALWVRDRGAWMAVGANAAWMWVLGSIARGGLLDVRFATESDAGLPAVAAAAIAAAVAVAWAGLRAGRASSDERPPAG
jgi:hypothetical protein